MSLNFVEHHALPGELPSDVAARAIAGEGVPDMAVFIVHNDRRVRVHRGDTPADVYARWAQTPAQTAPRAQPNDEYRVNGEWLEHLVRGVYQRVIKVAAAGRLANAAIEAVADKVPGR